MRRDPSRAQGASCARLTMPAARENRLFFAQVREDPLLELEALRPTPSGSYALVTSGGCTALSLLGRGAGAVACVDLNRSQNHLAELKLAALCALERNEALRFLGAAPGAARAEAYATAGALLTPGARAYWDRRPDAIRKGVLGSGVTEKFLAAVIFCLRSCIHGRARMDRLLASRTLEEQARFYREVWNTRSWRLLFTLLLNRWVFNRTYHPAFFRNVENPSFAGHFLSLCGRTLCEVPVRDNYFLHFLLRGAYPCEVEGGLPPYLDAEGVAALRAHPDRLLLVDGGFREYLATLPEDSLDGVSLSNICEWLDAGEQEALFGEIIRAVKPGGVVCFRNFVGWTDIPRRHAAHLGLEPGSEAWIRRDRSLMQSRFVSCRVRKGTP